MEWMIRLHDEDALELGNINAFLEELRARFKDRSQTLQAVAEVRDLKQEGGQQKSTFGSSAGTLASFRNGWRGYWSIISRRAWTENCSMPASTRESSNSQMVPDGQSARPQAKAMQEARCA